MSLNSEFKGMVCEFVSNSEMIFTKNGVVYFYRDNALESKFRVTPLFITFLLTFFPLVSRLMRWQFYNVIRSDAGEYFICFGHDIYVGNQNNLKKLEFNKKFRVFRGGVAVKKNKLYFGEYLSNEARDSVNIYSYDHNTGVLAVEHTFPKKEVRHIHAVKVTEERNGFLVFTGDLGLEARVIEFDSAFNKANLLFSGSEDFRAIYGLIYNDCLLYATDSQFQTNKIVIEDKKNNSITGLHDLKGPVFYGVHYNSKVLLSVVWEGAPSQVGSCAELVMLNLETNQLDVVLTKKKDFLSKKYFQFGQYLLPRIKGTPESIYVTPMGLCYPSGAVLEIKLNEL